MIGIIVPAADLPYYIGPSHDATKMPPGRVVRFSCRVLTGEAAERGPRAGTPVRIDAVGPRTFRIEGEIARTGGDVWIVGNATPLGTMED